MARRESIKYQVLKRIDSLKRFGESKHEAKQREKARCLATGEKWNPARVEGIFSHKTCDVYKEHALGCVEWIRANHGVKQLDQVTPGHVAAWLKDGMDRGLSAWTLKTKAAAMAKVLGCKTSDFPILLPNRERGNIHRSRPDREHDRHFSDSKNSDCVNFGRGTGLRRREMTAVTWKDVFRDDSGGVKVRTIGKGGRERVVTVLSSQVDHVWSMRERAREAGRDLVFEKVLNRMDVHSYRREYAMGRYKEIETVREPSASTYRRRDDGKVFDREILAEVSQEMGHTRVDVIVRHYLD